MSSNEPFVIERTYNASVEKVWRAITDKAQMKEWYFDLSEFKPEIGFEFSFKGCTPEDRVYTHLCRITDVVPNRKLSHTWLYEGYEGHSEVTWELFAEGDKTRVKLTHEGLDSFPKNITDFARKNFEEGWNDIVGRGLPEFLEKQ